MKDKNGKKITPPELRAKGIRLPRAKNLTVIAYADAPGSKNLSGSIADLFQRIQKAGKKGTPYATLVKHAKTKPRHTNWHVRILVKSKLIRVVAPEVSR